MSVSKLIQVDLQGKIVFGPEDSACTFLPSLHALHSSSHSNCSRSPDDIDSVSLHLAIYEARPEVGSIVHAHTMNARTFSMQGRIIDMICQVRFFLERC